MKRVCVCLAALAAVAGAGSALAASENPTPITIGDGASPPMLSTPYGSQILVNGQAGPVGGLTVTLNGLSHGFVEDIDVLLVAPNGARVLLMSDAGIGSIPEDQPVSLTFSDGAPALPQFGLLTSGTFAPSNYNGSLQPCVADPDPFPAPAPTGPNGAGLSSLNGLDPNGLWSLYVVDDCSGAQGAIAGGWGISLDGGTGVTAVSLLSFGAHRSLVGVDLRWRTASESDLLGFNLWRTRAGRTSKVNRALVPARGTGFALGWSYRLRDGAGRHGDSYRLQGVELSGRRSWLGSLLAPR